MMMFSTYISVIFLNHFIILKNDGFTSISYGSDNNDDCSGLNSAPPSLKFTSTQNFRT